MRALGLPVLLAGKVSHGVTSTLSPEGSGSGKGLVKLPAAPGACWTPMSTQHDRKTGSLREILPGGAFRRSTANSFRNVVIQSS